MCWKGKITDKKIAEKDISVIKIMSRYLNSNFMFISPFRSFIYEVNKLYREEQIEIRISSFISSSSLDNTYIINRGLHSYNPEKVTIKEDIFCLHVFSNTGNCNLLLKLSRVLLVIVKCIIPKGSIYYENECGEVVSDTIIITNKLYYQDEKI